MHDPEASFSDGTQPPDPLPAFPDALSAPAVGESGSEFEPMALPPVPDQRAFREAVEAALAGEPAPAPNAPASAPNTPAPAASAPPMGGAPRGTPPQRGASYRPGGPARPQPVAAGPAPRQRPASGPSGSLRPIAPANLRSRRGLAPGALPTGLTPAGWAIALGIVALVVLSLLGGFAESLSRLLH